MAPQKLPGTVTKFRGKFRARVSLNGSRVSLGTFATEADGWGAIAEFWRLHAAQVSQAPGVLSVIEWGRQYLDARETDGVHRSVHRDRSVWAARIASSKLGGQCIDTLTSRDIRGWLAEQVRTKSERTGERPSRQTVVNALNLLRVALEAAVEAGHIEANPARDVRAPKIARTTEGWDWLRADEVERLLSPTNELDPEARRIYTVAIFSGLRQGELWGLRWDDVDLKRSELRVRHSFDLPTKGGRVRRVPLLAPALAALKAQPRRCALVFPTRENTMRQSGDTAGLDGGLKIAHCRRVRFHDLRHTCASHLVQGTWAPEYMDRALRLEEVRDWLGHRSITTSERYAHLCADSLRGRVRNTQERAGLNRTQVDSLIPDDVAQLAEILAASEPPIRIERTTYGLRNRADFTVIPGGSVEPSPLPDQIRELLGRFARKQRPGDIEIVRALGEALGVLERAPAREVDSNAG